MCKLNVLRLIVFTINNNYLKKFEIFQYFFLTYLKVITLYKTIFFMKLKMYAVIQKGKRLNMITIKYIVKYIIFS